MKITSPFSGKESTVVFKIYATAKSFAHFKIENFNSSTSLKTYNVCIVALHCISHAGI